MQRQLESSIFFFIVINKDIKQPCFLSQPQGIFRLTLLHSNSAHSFLRAQPVLIYDKTLLLHSSLFISIITHFRETLPTAQQNNKKEKYVKKSLSTISLTCFYPENSHKLENHELQELLCGLTLSDNAYVENCSAGV